MLIVLAIFGEGLTKSSQLEGKGITKYSVESRVTSQLLTEARQIMTMLVQGSLRGTVGTVASMNLLPARVSSAHCSRALFSRGNSSN